MVVTSVFVRTTGGIHSSQNAEHEFSAQSRRARLQHRRGGRVIVQIGDCAAKRSSPIGADVPPQTQPLNGETAVHS